MLSLDDIDLGDVILARNDTHPESTWWFDPVDGRCLYFGPEDDTDRHELRTRNDLVLIDRAPQPVTDADDFVDDVVLVDEDLGLRLYEALHGRRGWRRFRDLVARTPVADQWQRFAVAREEERAARWLVDRGLAHVPDR